MTTERDRTMLERLTFFSDAVFAIAITLLVIEVHAPELRHPSELMLAQALLDLIPKYVGFLVSFLVVGRFWVGHHRVFGMLKAADPRLVWINLFLLLTVAFMPFPTAVFSAYASLHVGSAVYTGWLTLLGALHVATVRAALVGRRLVRDDVPDEDVTSTLRASWVPVLLGSSAFVMGMIHPMLALLTLVIGSPTIGFLVRHRWGKRAPA